MALIKLNDRAVKDATEFGSITSLGEMVFISKATASASASIEFTSGIDSTYKEYVFYFVNCHPSNNAVNFTFQADTGTNTNYNQTMTTTAFRTEHYEDDTFTDLSYDTGRDQAQGTGFQVLGREIGNDNDNSISGNLIIYNPSSSVFVKHFISTTNVIRTYTENRFIAGYFNTTTPITRFKFAMSSGNIDAGEILLFGIN